jgi:biotin carboxylase
MIEDGYSAPYLISRDKHNQILDIINKCAKIFGIMNGVLKGDFVYDEKNSKIKVFELASRTSGGRLCDRCHPLASGRNILYPLIQMAMNDPVDLSYVEMKRDLGVSQRFFFPPAGKIIKSIKNLTYLSHHPNVNDIYFDRSLLKNNKTREIKSHADRAGYVICTGKTRDEADQLALQITNDIDYVFED